MFKIKFKTEVPLSMGVTTI